MRDDRSVRTRACYLAIGVTVEGEREPLGIWWQDSEGAKFWLAVLNDLHQRGVQDVLICCVDGLAGFPEAIEAVFPEAWVQTCIVHQIRSSMRYVAYKDRKRVAAELKPIYRAPNIEAAEQELAAFDKRWGERCPMIADSWRARWEHITPFLGCPPTCAERSSRPTASRTSTARSEKTIKTRGHFPDEQAATKLIYLAIQRAETKWRTAYNWTNALRGLNPLRRPTARLTNDPSRLGLTHRSSDTLRCRDTTRSSPTRSFRALGDADAATVKGVRCYERHHRDPAKCQPKPRASSPRRGQVPNKVAPAKTKAAPVQAGIRSDPLATRGALDGPPALRTKSDRSRFDRVDAARDERNERERLRDEARYRRERLELYRARLYGGRAASQGKLRELQRASDGAAARLRRAEAAVSPTDLP